MILAVTFNVETTRKTVMESDGFTYIAKTTDEIWQQRAQACHSGVHTATNVYILALFCMLGASQYCHGCHTDETIKSLSDLNDIFL